MTYLQFTAYSLQSTVYSQQFFRVKAVIGERYSKIADAHTCVLDAFEDTNKAIRTTFRVLYSRIGIFGNLRQADLNLLLICSLRGYSGVAKQKPANENNNECSKRKKPQKNLTSSKIL